MQPRRSCQCTTSTGNVAKDNGAVPKQRLQFTRQVNRPPLSNLQDVAASTKIRQIGTTNIHCSTMLPPRFVEDTDHGLSKISQTTDGRIRSRSRSSTNSPNRQSKIITTSRKTTLPPNAKPVHSSTLLPSRSYCGGKPIQNETKPPTRTTALSFKKPLSNGSGVTSYQDEVFEDHYNGQKSNLPILSHKPSTRSSSTLKSSLNSKSTLAVIRQLPPEKTTLTEKLRERSKRYLNYSFNIVRNEYMKDIIIYLLSYENRFIVRKDALEQYVDTEFRTEVVNWLMQVGDVLGSSTSGPYFFFEAVRIFDHMLVVLRIGRDFYLLIAITAYWIAHKFWCNRFVLKTSQLFKLCNGRYSKSQFLIMERKILKSLDFKLNVPNPLEFLEYYIQFLELENNKYLPVASRFAIECFSLSKRFITTPSFILSAAALSVASNILYNRNTTYVKLKFPEWISRRELALHVKAMLNEIQVVLDRPENNEPVKKYMTAENYYIPRYFCGIDLNSFYRD